jgi:hypothetical protein
MRCCDQDGRCGLTTVTRDRLLTRFTHLFDRSPHTSSTSSTMRSLLLFLALSCCVGVSVCGQSPCAWNGYDFTSLSSTTLTVQDANYLYSIRPCGWLADQLACMDVSETTEACITPLSSGSVSIDVGEVAADREWSFLDSSQPGLGVQFQTNNGEQDQCTLPSGGMGPYTTNVQFECSTSPVPQLTVTGSFDECAFNYTITTPLACRPQPTPGECKWNEYDLT